MVTIRPETDDDVETSVALHIRAWQKAYRGMLPDAVLDSLDPVAWATRRREHRTSPQSTSLVAEADGEIVGFVQFGPDREEPALGEIYAIYVDPSHWGLGAGHALMTRALEALPQPVVRLWVLEQNERALRFYSRYGLHPDGARSVYTPRGSDTGAAEIRLQLLRG
jgi:ribosomal protein S18 acetylase RimI-like enzyme